MKLKTKVQWEILKEKIRLKWGLYSSIIWRKIVEERSLIMKGLGIFFLFLVSLQFSRLIDSFYKYGNDKRDRHEVEKSLVECEMNNIKYRSVAMNLAKRLKITEKDFNIDEWSK